MNIRPLETREELRACVALQEHTWGPGFREIVPYAVLWFTRRIGGVLLGAFDDDALIGFVFGVTGWRDGVPVHWSDMLAVRADARDRGIGVALKHAQRDALLAAGVQTAHWTFDPLQARNAHLNFNRLGAISREYVRDVYGASDSPLHRGIGTDRLVVEWQLASERVRARIDGRAADPCADDAPLVNPLEQHTDDIGCVQPDLEYDDARVRIAIPHELHSMKERAPALAAEWRACTRAALEAYLGRGYVVTGLAPLAERARAYVLELGVVEGSARG